MIIGVCECHVGFKTTKLLLAAVNQCFSSGIWTMTGFAEKVLWMLESGGTTKRDFLSSPARSVFQ